MKRKFLYLGVGLFTFLIGLLLVGLWSEHRLFQQAPSDPVALRSTEEDRIAEALFRYLLQEHQGFDVYFLSRDGADPSDDFATLSRSEPTHQKELPQSAGEVSQHS